MKPERKVIHEALANLPRTLEETYDRVLLQIPSAEQPAVLYTFQLIKHHNYLYPRKGFPFALLLQAISVNIERILGSRFSQKNTVYDEETVRELCACFISITSETAFHRKHEDDRVIRAVSFAHYTVREYLDSTNLSERLATHVTAIKQNWRLISLETILSEACHGSPKDTILQDWLLKDCHAAANLDDPVVKKMAKAVYEAFEDDLYIYCVVSAILMIREWPDEIAQQERTYRPAITLVDPLTFNFGLLRQIAWCIDKYFEYFHQDGREWPKVDCFWNIQWDSGLTDKRALHLTNVLLLAGRSTSGLSLARRFLHDKDVNHHFRARMVFTFASEEFATSAFDGTIVEIFAQTCESHIDAFKLLLEYGSGLYDPSAILLLSIEGHGCEMRPPHLDHECNESCILQRLLASGAKPDKGGYRVTPLQIAVYSWDLEAVVQLLDVGADVNSTGDSSGPFWGPKTVMSRFNCLHNASPLYICRNLEPYISEFMEWKRDGNAKRIEAILLRHGAESFVNTSERVTEILKLDSSDSSKDKS